MNQDVSYPTRRGDHGEVMAPYGVRNHGSLNKLGPSTDDGKQFHSRATTLLIFKQLIEGHVA
jgi:hypothetical protein